VNQAVEVATQVTAEFTENTNTDGLVGLAFSSINQIQQNGRSAPRNTFFFNIIDDLDQPVFTANLKHDATGSYNFGFIDDSLFTGTLSTVPVNSDGGFWGFDVDGFTINGQAIDSNIKSFSSIADTGTTLLLAPDSIVNAYYSQVTGADNSTGSFIYPCDSTMPDFGFTAGDTTVDIPGADMTFESVQPNSNSCFGGLQSSGSNACSGNTPCVIMGDIMFKSQFVVFDGATPSLSFAPQA
jgi:aspergillopepsin I